METENEANSTDEIEITPEMIEAGADIILGELGGSLPALFSAEDLAEQVFRAMRRMGS
jgi:hypothetical protein